MSKRRTPVSRTGPVQDPPRLEAPKPEPADLAPDLIDPNPYQPRSSKAPDPGAAELAASVARKGILEPILVRPSGARYKLLAGQRRLAAARAAGLLEVPVLIHRHLEHDEAGAIAVTYEENKRRLDVTPLEESDAVAHMVEQCGGDIGAAANQLHMSTKQAARRLHLRNLSPAWRAAAADDERPVSTWSAACLEVIARFPPATQDELLTSRYLPDKPSVKEVEELTAAATHDLGAAPWKLDDPDLVPEAGACAACPHRSGAAPLLFDDLRAGKRRSGADHCLLPACWQRKLEAKVAREDARLRGSHAEVVRLSTCYHDPRRRPGIVGGALRQHDVEPCSPQDSGALPAIHVDGKEAGQVTWVKLRPHVRADAGAAAPAKKEPPTTERRLARLRQLRLKSLSEELLAQLPEAGLRLEELAPRLPGLKELSAMVAALGTSGGGFCEAWEVASDARRTRWDRYDHFLADAEGEAAASLRCALYRRVEREVRLSVTYEPHKDVAALERDCQRVAIAFQIDYAELEAEARRRKPAPKDLREHDQPGGAGRPRAATQRVKAA